MIKKKMWLIITVLFWLNIFYMPFAFHRHGGNPLFIKGLLFLIIASSVGLYALYTCYFFFANSGSALEWDSLKSGFHGTVAAVSADQVAVRVRDAFYVIDIGSMRIGYSELVPGKKITKGIRGEVILSDSAVIK